MSKNKMQSLQRYTECYTAGTKRKERSVGVKADPRAQGLRRTGSTGRTQERKRRIGGRRENTGKETID